MGEQETNNDNHERIIKLETNSGKIEIKLEYIGQLIEKLDAKLDNKIEKLYEQFVTKTVLEEKLKVIQKDVDGIQSGLNQMRLEKQTAKAGIPNWLQALFSLAAVVVAVLAIVYK